MARLFATGEFQITPSTPGLRLPRLSVTRFTARTRPENEWVISHCKARTLPGRYAPAAA